MNAPEKAARPEFCFRITCVDCPSEVLGETDVKPANKARIRARNQARLAGWFFFKIEGKEYWRCKPCQTARIRDESERRILARAKKSRADKQAMKAAKREAEERRRTKPVGRAVAKADITLTEETEKLVHRNSFDKYIRHNLTPRMRLAASEYERQVEKSEGVSDKEFASDRVDSSNHSFGPPSQDILDALKWLNSVKQLIGVDAYHAVDKAVMKDQLPADIGAACHWAKTDRERRREGMSLIKNGLSGIANFMRLR